MPSEPSETPDQETGNGPEPDPGAVISGAEETLAEETSRPAGRLAKSTAFFAAATGLSRIAGLVREIFAASYFGASAAMSAFTIAFQIPNLVRSLFADAAIQAAFVPVFTEQLEKGRKLEAFRLASTMIFTVGLVLGMLTALMILIAPAIVGLFGYSGATESLTVALSRLLFPILLLLGLTGMVVGILNSYNRFAIFAISPFFWNVVIIAVLIGFAPAFPEGDEIYAYAVGVLAGTVVQMLLPLLDLRNTPYGIRRALVAPFKVAKGAFRDANLKRVLILMLPVTLSLGLVNFNLVINSYFGTLIPDELVRESAPAAIDKAFRIYMLPQGIFSVAIATVLFPTLARLAARGDFAELRSKMANGMRQILFLLVPAAAAILVLSEPMIRLVYERGEFIPFYTDLTAEALFWFAFSLPFNGLFLLLSRTFFSLQRPWIPTVIAVLNLVVTAAVAGALYREFGVGGIVFATTAATAASVAAQVIILRRRLGSMELTALVGSAVRVTIAAAALAVVAWLVWKVTDEAFGRELWGQIGSISLALIAGAVVYFAGTYLLRVPELAQVRGLLRRSR